MKETHKTYARVGFFLAGLGVLLGAFGAHILKELINETDLNSFNTGVRYQMIHALAIIFISLNYRKLDDQKTEIAIWLFIVGVIFFSSSLYLLSTRSLWVGESLNFIGFLTPIGGISLAIAWFILFFKGFAKFESSSDSNEVSSERKSSRKKHRKSRSSSNEPAIEKTHELNQGLQ